VKSFIQALHAANPSTPIFVAGFCWGGKHLVLLSADAEMHSLITAGFTAHPSRLSIPDDIHSLNNPVSFALGENDNSLKKESREQIEKIMEGKDGECVTYAGVGHGFAIRADPSRDEAREAAERAEDQCLSFFDRHRPK
jgi:dienelactone hydrolase